MAKVLKTAAIVVGAVALVATGIGAAAGLGLTFGLSAGTLGTIATVGTIASISAAALALVGAAAMPKGTLGGNATKFTIDRDSGIPYVMGRTASGGRVVHRQYYGQKDAYESWVVVHSLGPVKSVGPLLIDRVAVPQNGTAIGGSYAGYMWLDTQLGGCPEARALAGPQGPFPGWDATSRLSGLAADLWTMKFDDKGKVFPEGVPQRLRVLEGVFVYDPRKDDTYPGGSGSCRLGQEETYLASENPALHAITWAFGRYQNGMLVAGGGLGVWGIDLPPFVEWANVCDANGWKVGGTIFTTSDSKWDVLRNIAQAGSAEVSASGALLTCIFSAPRVSIGTISSADIMGDLDIPSTASMRDRRNTVIPRVRLESQGWEVVPIQAVSVPDYVALDGASRPKEITYPLVQDEHQGAVLAAYDIMNMREIDGMVLPAKIYALGYRPGDCLTLDIPEADLTDRDVIVRGREIDAATMGVTLTCRSETPGKHAFALGQTGVAPRTPDLTVPVRYPVIDTAELQQAILNSWIVEASAGIAIVAAAADGTITVANHTRRYPDGHADVAVHGGTVASGMAAGTAVSIAYDDPDRVGGTVTYHAYEDDNDAHASATNRARHYVGFVTIPATGTSTGGGGSVGGGRESYCVSDDTAVLLANPDGAGEGETKAASQLAVGDILWTQHEVTRKWGAYPVTAIDFIDADVFAADGLPRATTNHQFDRDGWWEKAGMLGEPAGRARVARISVEGARTYVTVEPNGGFVLNHNLKAEQPDQ